MESNLSTVWGPALNGSVSSELAARGAVYGNPSKTPGQVAYMNGNTPWVRITSGVKFGKVEKEKKEWGVGTGQQTTEKQSQFGQPVSWKFETVEPTGLGYKWEGEYVTGAGKYVKEGPEREVEDKLQSNYNVLGFVNQAGMGFAYRNDSFFGYRPRPGITKVSVKNRSVWGATLEADISLQVWSKDELEEIGKVWFKPGFTACLEWGWSMVLDGTEPSKSIPAVFDFLNDEDLVSITQRARKTRTPNHEILVGYVTNFSYTFQKNGSYECTIRILGTGSAVEGLKISAADGFKSPDKATSDSTTVVTWASAIGTGFKKIFSYGTKQKLPKPSEDEFFKKIPDTDIVPFSVNYDINWLGVLKNTTCVYMTLDSFFQILNVCNFYGKSPYVFVTQEAIDNHPDNKFDNYYATATNQFSLDPYVAVIPGKVAEVDGHTLLGRSPFVGKEGRILDIWINFNHFIDIVDGLVESQEENYFILDAINTLLADIQKAFGNINYFSLDFNEEGGIISVVDRNYICNKDIPSIAVSGLSTCVREFTVESKISDNISNEMSIAAQGSKNVSPALTCWNNGLLERHKVLDSSTNKDKGLKSDNKDDANSVVEFWRNARKLYTVFFNGGISSTSTESAGEVAGNYRLQLKGEELFSAKFNEEHGKDSELPAGVFPVEIKLTFQGIAGFVVGECFKVKSPSPIPSIYDTWGYIVKNVEQSIDRSAWTTTVYTQYFPIGSSGQNFSSNINNKEDKAEDIAPASETANHTCYNVFAYDRK